MKSTTSVKPQTVQRARVLVDAKGKALGRVGVRVAELLMGKRKPYYVDYLDCGDYVTVINAKEVVLSGNKETEKKYYRHSGYPGGLKTVTVAKSRERDPRFLIEKTVKGMLPKTKLGRAMYKKLDVKSGSAHNLEDGEYLVIEI
jgi:large subunit ribosomal protein L13